MIMDECPKKTNDYDLIKKSMEFVNVLGRKIKKTIWIKSS